MFELNTWKLGVTEYERDLKVLDVRVGVSCFRICRFTEGETTTRTG